MGVSASNELFVGMDVFGSRGFAFFFTNLI